MKINIAILLTTLGFITINLSAQDNTNKSKFKQLGTELPTPNVYRTASGAPGHEYFQQKADYKISIELVDSTQKIYGEETITYTNNSPDELSYLWLQLDQNKRATNSMANKVEKGEIRDNMSFEQLEKTLYEFDGGFKIEWVKGVDNKGLPYTINETMMRVDLPAPLKKGQKYSFKIKWWYNINDRMKIGGRSGYEYFPKEDNYLYTIAQFFPRMAVYSDYQGWMHKQFIGHGEFTLPFGDYQVSITVPADHVIAATGELQNATNVLTAEQRSRYDRARKSTDKPVFIVTAEEALDAEKQKSTATKTWQFKATNVRDFAFASSRKFIWDAMAVTVGSKTTMAESFYPKEGNPLWEQYSTRVVAHTLKVYSKHTIDYPYPRAISVHTNQIGMEYPMICFNGGRPEADGTYSESTKYGMLGVIMHEVGHNFFPMIINSDERQWTWMDEGLNTFVQFLTEQEWDVDYPSRRGPAYKMVDYMKGDKAGMMPIMTNAESVLQHGNNAYGKPATALNILRETVLGRELFDYAFKEYARRWAFKHPTPADFFRTMEDASGTDLDWFWRGWFYTTNHVDIALTDVQWFEINTQEPAAQKANEQRQQAELQRGITYQRNKDNATVVSTDTAVLDFYYKTKGQVADWEVQDYERYLASLTEEEKQLLNSGWQAYQLSFSNVGGLVMPVILEFAFADGTTEIVRLPAEIWLRSEEEFTKVFWFQKEVMGITLDPFLETADTDRDNNYWPQRAEPSRFKLYKQRDWQQGGNPMQKAKRN
jgi:hypothetical protein